MTNTIKTVEELRANIKANNCVARDIELEVTHSKLVEVFTKLLTRATKEVIRDYIESECFAENDFNYITTSAVKYRQTLKSEIIKVLAWKLANKVMDMREQEAKKTVNMVIETTDDLKNALDSATRIEQVSELLHALKVSFLRLYIKEEGYDYGKPLNKVTKIEMIDRLMSVYSDRLEENEKPEAEAEPTLEELEQETGFTFCRRLGQEFLSGEKSLEQLNSQIESLKRSMKYGDNSGSLHGLAYAFGIIIEGKSCEELMSEIEEFIKNREFKALSSIDKLNGIIEGKYSTEAITRLIWECERHEFIRLLNMDEQELIQKNRENHYCATDNDYIEDRIIHELERRTFRHEPVIAHEDLPEISEEAYKKASDEEYRYRVEERKLRSEYSQLQFDVHSMRKQWLGLCEVIRKSEIKATRHLGGFEDLKYKVRMQYREIRLRSLRLYREMKRVIRLCNEQKSLCKAIENQLKKCAVKKQSYSISMIIAVLQRTIKAISKY